MSSFWVATRPLALLAIVLLSVLSLSRAVLATMAWSRVDASDAALFIALQGLRFDLVIVGLALIWPLFLTPILLTSSYGIKAWKFVLSIYIPLVVMFLLFLELLTPSFIAQFDARPNILFIEYWAYPKDIFATIWSAYRLELIVILTLVLITGFVVFRYVSHLLMLVTPVKFAVVIPVSLALLLICGMCIRSSFGTKPASPSTIARTTDGLLNELPLNSAYTVAYAAYEMGYEDSKRSPYSDMNAQLALEIVRREMHVEQAAFSRSLGGTWHTRTASKNWDTPKNLVIILAESLGADHVGSMGGPDVTPNVDALREQGWSFDQLYATGTRSNRGIEAILTGFLPTSSRSTVKLTKSQRDFYTIARSLKQAGYDTSFIYGGQASFENRRRFFSNNGFDLIVEEEDYVQPVYKGTWGVSDEDVFKRAHEEYIKTRDTPFFSLIFTSSNHVPFDYPEGRIELYDAEKKTVNNAVKYADYAIGEFVAMARQSDYWKDTIFLLVADHDSRMYGADLIPIKRFHIPGVIFGEGIVPRHDNRIVSQVDLAPTLLSLIGVSGVHPMPGRDLTTSAENVPGRAIMQFNGIQAYMEQDEVVVLQKDQSPKSFRYDGGRLIEISNPSMSLVEKAVAHATWATDTYQSGAYKVINTQIEKSHHAVQ